MKASSRHITLTLFAILLTATLHAQNPRGSLRGTVQDATGARISSAKIVAHLSSSSMQREAASEDRGEFRLDDLLPGNYRITISAAGFAPAQADVSIAVDHCTRDYGHDETRGGLGNRQRAGEFFLDYDRND